MQITIVVFLVFALLHVFLYGSKPSKGIREHDYISLRQTNCIKGVSALGVLLVHTTAVIACRPFDFILTSTGNLFVGLFFFYSGYGTMFQYERRGEAYLKGFPRKKLKNLLFPWLLLALAAPVYYALGAPSTAAYTSPFPLSVFFERVGEWVPNGWFIFVLLLFELVFYCFARLHPKNGSTLILWYFLFTTAYMVIMKKLAMGFWWYSRSHCFLLGLIWSKYEPNIISAVKKCFWICWFVLAACTVWLFSWFIKSGEPIASTVLLLTAFIPFVQLTCMKVSFENPMLDFFGRISMSIYLTHGFALGILHSNLVNISVDWLYALTALLLTIDASVVLNFFLTKFVFRFPFRKEPKSYKVPVK